MVSSILLLFAFSASAQRVVAEKALTVAAGTYTSFDWNFDKPTTVKGKFRATGGSHNDIEVYILDDDGFENWRNGNQAQTYYNSGRVTVGTYGVTLPAGSYHLVFNNRFSVVSNKAVALWFLE